MASHQHPNVFPLWPTPTQEQRERWVRAQDYAPFKPIDAGEYLRARIRPTFGERLVSSVRRRAYAIGWALYFFAVSIGCYFAFELGRSFYL